jgi:transcriptional regulator GlxA family with amidase domain
MTHQVAMLAFDGVNLLDVAGPLQAFAGVERLGTCTSPYEITLISERGGPIQTSAGVPLLTEPLISAEDRRIDTLIIPGGSPNGAPATPPVLVDFIRRKSKSVERVCSVCTGAFMLAESGLLDGRRAATHWGWADHFRARYPRVRLDSDAIFVREGRIWSSAGVTAGIDLTLALIQQDLGHAVSIGVARQLVVFLKRPGGQSQYSAPLASQAAASPAFAELHAWMAGRLKEDLRVERLAEHCGMSTRTFARTYAAQVGATPARTLETMRLEAARRALEDGVASLKRVAVDVGYGDEQNLRRAFLRRLGVTPLEYRARFSQLRAEGRPPVLPLERIGA